MKVYANREEAERLEGAFQGLDPESYGDVTFAELDFPKGHVFGFQERGKIRVAWSNACERCGCPVREGDDCDVCRA